ncbi:DarT ssDNA thymidine ADP-ribosyltransferase family protein [Massilia oculi]|uniref:DarT ssDNA thymidine ADP-ribosyltransferase family protein n=1 Tax=Massilia oculi TaxID=945844 RepID=UPI0028AFDC04|nr:DarT ssDNA thymidine ADP-ribosyltransferase family protein [Massilia oculi]
MQQAVENRKIDWIFHFTNARNIDAILRDGIIPRATLEHTKAAAEYNDSYRLDGFKNASCFSIGHPNYKMFYTLRMARPDEEWVVLACRAEVLWLKDCAFCVENAASNTVTNLPIAARKGVNAFNRIFDEHAGKPSRLELGLTPDYPTNPQAEVLVFDKVEPHFIDGGVCQKKELADRLVKKHGSQFNFSQNSAFFYPRSDHTHWK